LLFDRWQLPFDHYPGQAAEVEGRAHQRLRLAWFGKRLLGKPGDAAQDD
jgi:hypothetical protein